MGSTLQAILLTILLVFTLAIIIKIYTGHPKFNFKKKNIDPDEEVDEYKKEYLKITSDINYVKSKWDSYIHTSLKADLETFRDWSKRNPCRDDSSNKFWTVVDVKTDRFKIMKCGERWSSVRIWVNYQFDESNFSIKVERLQTTDIDLKLTKEMVDMVKKYISIVKINDKIRENNSSLTSFNEMVNIVGKDVVRDSRIDNILSELE